ncbi:aminotransferase-like domain-containing protein [Labrys wisconsinensis]|uniref:DNA-binding transcriptional MocR family regulator n=1 Tax=Labrys wisconsinensis TaxID=425677 RepID=A0ABU0JBU4_9HYPH|nr:PLP-dependent aminotransferase family protein [Labrys wisconsinensis]MDQ0471045.1 DNA-binding transcriptional MocR family regulator [Labrys wisconsinensis]
MDGSQITKVIDLTRTTPPMPPYLGDLLKDTLREIEADDEADSLLRHHRFAGFESDRTAGAAWLAMRLREVPDPNRVIVTNGTQNALFLLFAGLVGRDGLLVTERLTYHGIHAYARLLGMRTTTVAMDGEGALPDDFDSICRKERPSALFVMPTLQNPTTAIMGQVRRLELAAVARRHGVPIVEDDVYGLLPREAPPPIAALAPDVAYYAAGLAKCVATGLRISYVLAPSARLAEKIVQPLRLMSTWFPAPLQAAVAARWIRSGAAQRVLNDIRDETAARQRIVAAALAGFPHMTKPEALHVWLAVPAGRGSSVEFVHALEQAGVIVQGSRSFATESAHEVPAVRLTIGKQSDRAELDEALRRVAALLPHGHHHDVLAVSST